MIKYDTKGIYKPLFAMGEQRYFVLETLAINFPPCCKKKVTALDILLEHVQQHRQLIFL